jgi:pyruvate carboxylase
VNIRIDGPVLPQAGNVYRVAYPGGQFSNLATLNVAMGVARDWNHSHTDPKSQAHVQYVSPDTTQQHKDT